MIPFVRPVDLALVVLTLWFCAVSIAALGQVIETHFYLYMEP